MAEQHERDEIDRRLREHARAWRASLPQEATLDDADLTDRGRRRRRWLTPALAAAAAAALIAGVMLAVHRDPAVAPGPADGDVTPGVVPWEPLPATHPTLPVHRVAPSPDPATFVGTRACKAGDVAHGRPQRGAAAGTMYASVSLRLIGPSPCLMQGYPTVQPLDHGQPAPVEVRREVDGGKGDTATPVLLSERNGAVLRVGWAVSHSCGQLTVDGLAVTLPAGAGSFTVGGFGTSSCNGPEEGRRPLVVMPLVQERSRPAEIRSPFDRVTATGDLHLSVRPGAPARFTVTLTSPQDLPLVPCPDYSIVTAAGAQRHALNCAAVPHRKDGVPVLPAGVPVRFAMQADTGDRSTAKLVWRLQTPAARVALDGTLTVAAIPTDAK